MFIILLFVLLDGWVIIDFKKQLLHALSVHARKLWTEFKSKIVFFRNELDLNEIIQVSKYDPIEFLYCFMFLIINDTNPPPEPCSTF